MLKLKMLIIKLTLIHIETFFTTKSGKIFPFSYYLKCLVLTNEF